MNDSELIEQRDKLLKAQGIVVVCESPLELEMDDEDNESKATGDFAEMIVSFALYAERLAIKRWQGISKGDKIYQQVAEEEDRIGYIAYKVTKVNKTKRFVKAKRLTKDGVSDEVVKLKSFYTEEEVQHE